MRLDAAESALLSSARLTLQKIERFTMDVSDQIHAQLVKAGVSLAASLPDDWVNGLIRSVAKDNQIRHVPVGREAETIAVCAGAFFGGVR